jgi:hypothetical protein
MWRILCGNTDFFIVAHSLPQHISPGCGAFSAATHIYRLWRILCSNTYLPAVAHYLQQHIQSAIYQCPLCDIIFVFF